MLWMLHMLADGAGAVDADAAAGAADATSAADASDAADDEKNRYNNCLERR